MRPKDQSPDVDRQAEQIFDSTRIMRPMFGTINHAPVSWSNKRSQVLPFAVVSILVLYEDGRQVDATPFIVLDDDLFLRKMDMLLVFKIKS